MKQTTLRDLGMAVLACIGVALLFTTARAGYDPLAEKCVFYVRANTYALIMYTQDYDENFPPMTDTAVLNTLIAPFNQPNRSRCPSTGLLYQPNAALSYQVMAAIQNPSLTESFRDAQPHRDGNSTIGYLNYRVERKGIPLNLEQQCLVNAKDTVTSLAMYVQDYDETLPPIDRSGKVFLTQLRPYNRQSTGPFCPDTRTLFVPNTQLSRKSLASITNPGATYAFQDIRAHRRDNEHTTAFMDWHVVHRGTKIPDPPTYPFVPNASCVSRAKQVGLALQLYAQDYDETLPPMQSQAVFQTVLQPYTKSPDPFVCPVINKAFLPDASLSYTPMSALISPSTTEVFRDAAPHPDGKYTIGYADGHAKH